MSNENTDNRIDPNLIIMFLYCQCGGNGRGLTDGAFSSAAPQRKTAVTDHSNSRLRGQWSGGSDWSNRDWQDISLVHTTKTSMVQILSFIKSDMERTKRKKQNKQTKTYGCQQGQIFSILTKIKQIKKQSQLYNGNT